MTALLLSPHNDDAVLFAAFTCHAEKPHVVTVLRSVNQERSGITWQEREAEDAAAMEILGCTWEQWAYDDDAPDWDAIRARIAELAPAFEMVYAPACILHGHPQHNEVAKIAADLTSPTRFYTTYVYGGPRIDGLVEVHPTREAILAKLRALACYESQILRGPSRFWMMPLNEYLT